MMARSVACSAQEHRLDVVRVNFSGVHYRTKLVVPEPECTHAVGPRTGGITMAPGDPTVYGLCLGTLVVMGMLVLLAT
jgi:hypothetical protein